MTRPAKMPRQFLSSREAEKALRKLCKLSGESRSHEIREAVLERQGRAERAAEAEAVYEARGPVAGSMMPGGEA